MTQFDPATLDSLREAAGVLVKATLLLGAGALIAALLRRSSAAVRHEVWTLTLAACLALAMVAPWAPRLELPIAYPPATVPAAAAAAAGSAPRTLAPSSPRPAIPAEIVGAPAPWRPEAFALAGWIWFLGTAAVLASSALGHLALRRLARAAEPLAAEPWTTLLREARAATGTRAPIDLRRSPGVGTPLTWGTRRPIVLLPAAAESWPLERRRAALLHELAHVARRDYLTQLAGYLACALYWFHPGVWIARRRQRRESERACDDRVLATGTPAAEYAEQLLAVARGALAHRHPPAVFTDLAVGMARASTLESRLLAVLDERRPRRAVARGVRILAAAGLALALPPLAGLAAVGRDAEDPGPNRGGGDPGCSTEDGGRFECALDVRPGGRLRLDLESGAAVEIRGWDEPRVELRARLEASDPLGSRAEMRRENNGVVVRAWYVGNRRSWSSSHRMVLRVPRRFDVELDSSGGDLTLDGLEGNFRGQTGGGDLVLTNLRGAADLSTGGGEIRVTDCHLDGEVSTGGGPVILSRVTGGLRGDSGSGPVVRSDARSDARGAAGTSASDAGDLEGLELEKERISPPAGTGRLHIRKAGGGIKLTEAPGGAVVSTGGGDIEVGAAAGSVEAETGGGDLTLGPVAGSVRATTGAGDVEITVVDAGAEPQSVEVSSGSGAVVIELPADFDGVIELETAYTRSFGRETRIRSPWPLEQETTAWRDAGDWGDPREGTPRRYVRARGTLGAGRGLVRVKTVNGDIELRRGR